MLRTVPVAGREEEVGCGSHEGRRVLVSRTAQLAGARMMAHHILGQGYEEEVEHRADRVSDPEGRPDMETEALGVLGRSRSRIPAGEDAEEQEALPIGLEVVVL